MGLETVLFIIVGAMAVAAAAGMLFSQNAVHAALFLVLNMACIAFFYLMLSAPFMAMVQITVYAGAIMVLFLFVIMLLGAERVGLGLTERRLRWQVPIAFVLTLAFVVTVVAAVIGGSIPAPAEMSEVAASAYGSPAEIGTLLFTRYLLPLEMVAILLLAATIGAVVLARDTIPQKRNLRAQAARAAELREMVSSIIVVPEEEEEEPAKAKPEPEPEQPTTPEPVGH